MLSRNEIINKLKHGVFQVTFTKVDGTERTMSCTLQSALMPPPSKDDPLTQKKVRNITEDVLVVFCTDKQEFRSFRVNNVIKIEPITDPSINLWFNFDTSFHIDLLMGIDTDDFGFIIFENKNERYV
jgi:WYL_2, Sm-like SH3 beta-barrel fold